MKSPFFRSFKSWIQNYSFSQKFQKSLLCSLSKGFQDSTKEEDNNNIVVNLYLDNLADISCSKL